eukprot:TRINITY_DN74466_c0_g1_i1.p1 TRINITY_DN74466_c0_g1~~TRINITY_DN74466_c0_g1_i1.p1  ORF type:complete len:590 (+),score=87.99 TRINITY_DN74466_c0_g1_i1:101-1870(+)
MPPAEHDDANASSALRPDDYYSGAPADACEEAPSAETLPTVLPHANTAEEDEELPTEPEPQLWPLKRSLTDPTSMTSSTETQCSSIASGASGSLRFFPGGLRRTGAVPPKLRVEQTVGPDGTSSSSSLGSARKLRLAAMVADSAAPPIAMDAPLTSARDPPSLCSVGFVSPACVPGLSLTPRIRDAWSYTSEPEILSSARRWQEWRSRQFPVLLSRTVASTLGSVSLQRSPSTFRCRICLENVAVTGKVVLSSCSLDAHATCLECMKMYLQSRITEGRVDDLRCPCATSCSSGEVCSGTITEQEVKQWLDKELVEKFERFSRMKADPQLRACPSCHHLCPPSLRDDGSIIADMSCGQCSAYFCHYHSNAHARGAEACAEYERTCVRQQLLAASECGLKACPRCGAATQKASGCNHMTCTCKCDWCWVCGSKLDNVGWHYNPANPRSCMKFQEGVQLTPRQAKIMVVCRIFGIPAMFFALLCVILFVVSLLVLSFVPVCFLCRENAVKAWIVLGGIFAGLPLAAFCFCWAVLASLFWLLLKPFGANEVHYLFLVGVPAETTLAIYESMIGGDDVGPVTADSPGESQAPPV